MVTKYEIEARLAKAALRVTEIRDDVVFGAYDNVPGMIKELAAILAEQADRIAALERTNSVEP